MNFGPDLIRWIKLLYKNARAAIICNGGISENFDITQGVRQGCPISALLYVIYAAFQGSWIQNHPNSAPIIPPDDRPLAKQQFADDIIMIKQLEGESLDTILNTANAIVKDALTPLQEFCSASGREVQPCKKPKLKSKC